MTTKAYVLSFCFPDSFTASALKMPSGGWYLSEVKDGFARAKRPATPEEIERYGDLKNPKNRYFERTAQDENESI